MATKNFSYEVAKTELGRGDISRIINGTIAGISPVEALKILAQSGNVYCAVIFDQSDPNAPRTRYVSEAMAKQNYADDIRRKIDEKHIGLEVIVDASNAPALPRIEAQVQGSNFLGDYEWKPILALTAKGWISFE